MYRYFKVHVFTSDSKFQIGVKEVRHSNSNFAHSFDFHRLTNFAKSINQMSFLFGVSCNIHLQFTRCRSIFRRVVVPKGFYSEDCYPRGSLCRRFFTPNGHYSEDFYPEGSLFRNSE